MVEAASPKQKQEGFSCLACPVLRYGLCSRSLNRRWASRLNFLESYKHVSPTYPFSLFSSTITCFSAFPTANIQAYEKERATTDGSYVVSIYWSLFISSKDSLGCDNRVRLRTDPFKSIESWLTVGAWGPSSRGGGGVLPIMAHEGRLRPKGVRFSRFGCMKR